MSQLSLNTMKKGSSLFPSDLGGDREVRAASGGEIKPTQDTKDDAEYVKIDSHALSSLLTKLSADSKEKKSDVMPALKMGVGRSVPLSDVKVRLVYDFKITPSTSSALATWQGVSAFSDSQVSSYWKNLFQVYRVDSAFITLDFHEYMNMVGVADKVAAMGISYRKTTSPAIPGYSSISDDSAFRPARWSQAKPVITYHVTPEMLKNGGFTAQANMGVGTSVQFTKWAPLDAEYAQGYIHICTQDTFCAGTSGRSIIGRLVLNVTLSSRI